MCKTIFGDTILDKAACSFAKVNIGRNVLQEAFRAVFCLLGGRTAKPSEARAQRLVVIIIPVVHWVFFDLGIDLY